MRSRRFVPHRLLIVFLDGLLLLSMLPAFAQDELHPPEFLFRDENRLILVNGYTGETTDLAIEVADRDYFEWSPDGRYLLALLQNGEEYRRCLNLYDVNSQIWLYEHPLACAVEDATFSHDATRVAYSTYDSKNGTLWLHTLENAQTVQVYSTTDGIEVFPAGINRIAWSPRDEYLTFQPYKSLAGGGRITLVVANVDTGTSYTIVGGFDGYYADYDPIWSLDEEWFLLKLQEEYVTSGALGVTNHRGDLFLISAVDGEQYRLTYTPVDEETNIRWLPDGGIAYNTVQHIALSIDDALNMVPPSPESIIMPEPIDPLEYVFSNIYPYPTEGLYAWVVQGGSADGGSFTTLNIGSRPLPPDRIVFTASLPENYEYNVIIGWRP